MKIIPYDNRFMTRITKMDSDFCYKEIIDDYKISKIELSPFFDYETFKFYIHIYNGIKNYYIETPQISTPTGYSYTVAIEVSII